MEFEEEDEEREHEEEDDDDEEEAMPLQVNYDYHSLGREKLLGGAGDGATSSPATTAKGGGPARYRECMRNHAVSLGGHAVDGCREFMPARDDGSIESLKCAACGCHRNFHRKETDGEYAFPSQFSTYYHSGGGGRGYLQAAAAAPRRLLALPSSSREDEDASNPSGSTGAAAAKKRSRTKFTVEQKEKMLAFSERLGWRIRKHDEAAVQQFCEENDVRRHVLKVWMHNNKYTLGKKP